MRNKRGSIILALLIVILLIGVGIYYITKYFNVDTEVNINLTYKNSSEGAIVEQQNSTNETEMGNPASLLCEERGYILESRISQSKGQYNVCIDNEGNECEEWAYFRGECELIEQ